MGADSRTLPKGKRSGSPFLPQADSDTSSPLKRLLWILNTGAQWHMLPQGYPNYKTVHRRFQQWCREEVASPPAGALGVLFQAFAIGSRTVSTSHVATFATTREYGCASHRDVSL